MPWSCCALCLKEDVSAILAIITEQGWGRPLIGGCLLDDVVCSRQPSVPD